jgi:hypothetical protein
MQNLEKSTTKMKITETKVRSVGGAGGVVEEMREIWPKPGEISSNLATKLLVCSPHERRPPHHLLHALSSSTKTKNQNQKKSEV